MPVVHLDIETRSRVDLKKYSVYRYVRCPDFKILMCDFAVDWGDVEHLENEDDILDMIQTYRRLDATFIAHNAPFERVCFSEALGMKPGTYLPPAEWRDTMAIGAELGYPKSLGMMARSLGGEQKDEAGTRLINLFCKPVSVGKRKGLWNDATTHPEEWLEFVMYCGQDVATLMSVDRELEAQGGWPTPMEEQVFLTDQIINDRGIAIDVAMAEAAVLAGTEVTEDQKQQVRDITEETGHLVENPNSLDQLKAWFEHVGFPMENMKAETVERALASVPPPVVKQVLELRQDLALAAPAKFKAASSAQVDGRLRGTLAFFGAHTGRWAGRGCQPQNLPRASFTMEDPETGKKVWDQPSENVAITDLLLGNGASSPVLKKLVRPMFQINGCVVDYAAIEARVIAGLAGEDWAIQAFREGRDIYVETAERMGGLTRAQGKIAVLALGYNGGAGSLKAMASDSDFITIDGVRMPLATAPDDILYEQYVWPWRQANSNIVKLWALLDKRFRTGGDVGDYLRFEKAMGNRDRLLRLPSGRMIGYRKCGIQKRKKWNEYKQRWETREVLTFWSPEGRRVDTYGGRLAENATQAVARDLLAEALVRLERAGLRVVAHVHDEVLVEGTRDVDLVSEIMCQAPAWAEGWLPIDGEGFVTDRYRKG